MTNRVMTNSTLLSFTCLSLYEITIKIIGLSRKRKNMNGKSYREIKLIQHIKILHFQTPCNISEID